MPALRSLYTVSLLAACLAQAHARAGPSHNEVQRRNQDQGYGQGQGGGYGGDRGQDYGQGQGQDYGQDKSQDYGNGGWEDAGDMVKNEVIVTVTLTEMMTVTAPAPVQANVPPATVRPPYSTLAFQQRDTDNG